MSSVMSSSSSSSLNEHMKEDIGVRRWRTKKAAIRCSPISIEYVLTYTFLIHNSSGDPHATTTILSIILKKNFIFVPVGGLEYDEIDSILSVIVFMLFFSLFLSLTVRV
ncbi:hypothetical protein BS78_05G224500 [Paspalum vaginatum]|nr:hypothetical protein BS78_05G224500 [Paspalum vaginatum]